VILSVWGHPANISGLRKAAAHSNRWDSQGVLVVKNPPANVGHARDTVLIPGSGRFPGGKMATHSSLLAWKIP